MSPTIHATAIAIDGRAVLLVGPSGCGKSDLALRLIDRGAVLIADDRVVVIAHDGTVRAAPPATIAGLIEVRGVGLVALPHVADIAIALVVDLAAPPPRLPEPATRDIAGVAVRLVALDPFAASATIKVELALGGQGSTISDGR